MVNWQYFPKSRLVPIHLEELVQVFRHKIEHINSEDHKLSSNEVLEILREDFESFGFMVERSKKKNDKIKVPVLFGRNGVLEKYFEADGFNEVTKTVIEVEAGRGVTNYQFLKDLFQACMMHDVDYLVIAVRNVYYGKNKDFETMCSFFETLYASNRLSLPLKVILAIGY